MKITCISCGLIKDFREFYHNNKKKCKDCYKEHQKKYQKKYIKKMKKENPGKIRKINNKRSQNYRKKHAEKIKDKRNKRLKEKRKKNPIFKLSNTIRSSINQSLKNGNYTKKSNTYKTLGVNYGEFYNWINTYASNGLNFKKDNVHLDHVIPKCYANTEKELLALNHYSNLQLLSADDNFKKRDSEPEFENLKRVFDHHPNKKILHSILFE